MRDGAFFFAFVPFQTCSRPERTNRLAKKSAFAVDHVAEKRVHFSDKNMVKLIESARILLDLVISPDRNTR
jgi:hypothetical protein